MSKRISILAVAIVLAGTLFGIFGVNAPLLAQSPSQVPKSAGGPGNFYAYQAGMFWEYNMTTINAINPFDMDGNDEGNKTIYETTSVTTEDRSGMPAHTGVYDLLNGFIYHSIDENETWVLDHKYDGVESTPQAFSERNATDIVTNSGPVIFPGAGVDFTGGFLDQMLAGSPLDSFEVRYMGKDVENAWWIYLWDADNTGDIYTMNFTKDDLAVTKLEYWNGTVCNVSVNLVRVGNRALWSYPPIGSLFEWNYTTVLPGNAFEMPTYYAGNHTRQKILGLIHEQNATSGVWLDILPIERAIQNGTEGWVPGSNQTDPEGTRVKNVTIGIVCPMTYYEGPATLVPRNESGNVDMIWVNRSLAYALSHDQGGDGGGAPAFDSYFVDQDNSLMIWGSSTQFFNLTIVYDGNGVLLQMIQRNTLTHAILMQIDLVHSFWGKQVWAPSSHQTVCYNITRADEDVGYEAGTVLKSEVNFYAGSLVFDGHRQKEETAELWANGSLSVYNKTSYLRTPEEVQQNVLHYAVNDTFDHEYADGFLWWLPTRDGALDIDWIAAKSVYGSKIDTAHGNDWDLLMGEYTITAQTATTVRVENATGKFLEIEWNADGSPNVIKMGQGAVTTIQIDKIPCDGPPALVWGLTAGDEMRALFEVYNPANQYAIGDLEGVEEGTMVDLIVTGALGSGVYDMRSGDSEPGRYYDLALKTTVKLANLSAPNTWETVMNDELYVAINEVDHILDVDGPLAAMPLRQGKGLARDWIDNFLTIMLSRTEDDMGTYFNQWAWQDANTIRIWNSSNSAEFTYTLNTTNGLWEDMTIKNAAGNTYMKLTRIYYVPSASFAGLPESFGTPTYSYQKSLPTGNDQNVVLDTGTVKLNATLDTKGPVKLTMGVWNDNPSGVGTGLKDKNDNEVAVFFALEVDTPANVQFPITVTVTLPDGLPEGLSDSEMAKKLGTVVWDATEGAWVAEDFKITVDLAANTATIEIDHLSVFSLGLSSSSGGDTFALDIPGYTPLFVFIAGIGAALLLVAKHKKRL